MECHNLSVSEMRKSVENLVISSHDAIGQSISHALSFSGAITHQVSHHNSSDHKNVSRSPSPCRHLSPPILEHGDSSSQSPDTGDNVRTSRSSGDGSFSSVNSSVGVSLSLSTQPPEAPPPLRRSSSQEAQQRGGQPASPSGAPPQPNQPKASDSKPKKKAWYSALYPTYKSRSEDFKRIFKDVPDDERLIVDYSCAIQKDILVHGRLYVSQNYLCFYANLFRWETFLCLRWRDVTAITKEKTALVIPNAILVSTENEKHFLTSFAGRDKAYLMLFRVWQNALMDRPMSSQEMWQWVHICYGEELGFNSDDEDYPQNFIEEDKLSGIRISAESITEDILEKNMEISQGAAPGGEDAAVAAHQHNSAELPLGAPQWRRCTCHPQDKHVTNGSFNGGGDTLPTDMSDSSESEPDKPVSFGHEVHQCSDPHEGRKLLSEDIHVHIDQLFTMIFTNSKFYLELLAVRKTTDLVQVPWKHDPESGLKCRKVSFKLVLGQAVGPKSTQVTETQVMLACTRPGHLYSIEVTSANAGIPYADSFTVMVHYCLQRVSENVTNLQVFGQVKYKKNVWGLVKTFIEKNCYAGLEDHFDCFIKCLQAEVEDERGPSKRKSRRRRKGIGVQRELEVGNSPASPLHRPLASLKSTGAPLLRPTAPAAAAPSPRLLWAVLAVLGALLVLNVALYCRLWAIEESAPRVYEDIDNLPPNFMGEQAPTPEVIAQWTKMLKEQSSFHIEELDKWRKALNNAIHLLKQTETALANLQSIVKPATDGGQFSGSPHTEL